LCREHPRQLPKPKVKLYTGGYHARVPPQGGNPGLTGSHRLSAIGAKTVCGLHGATASCTHPYPIRRCAAGSRGHRAAPIALQERSPFPHPY
jgi:hypothetical protein